MALLSRLFSSKKNNKPSCNTNAEKNERSSWKPFTFGKDQVRVLLFRECDWRGRKLLFDSNAVQKVALENSCKLRFASRQKPDKCKKEGFVEVTNGYGYQYTKPSSDAKLLEEMMFGAVAMTFRGTALKVHSMATPNRLMCTKVFPSPVVTHTNRRTSDRSLEDSYGSSVNSMSEYFSQNSGSESLLASGPLDVPIGEIAVPKASRYNSVEGDSGFCGDFSLQSVSSVGSPSYWTPVASPEARNSLGSLCGGRGRQSGGGSLSSLQRRWIRNMTTSLELGLAGQTEDVQSSCTGRHRRTKLGLAVVVTLTEERTREMEVFLFEHMSIIEAMIERLRFTVERAYLRKETFVHLMHEGWSDMQESVCDMLCSQRLLCPIWLTLTSAENKSHASLASMFLQDLCSLISTLDTKATNFFVSTLVTGILTHHLGWVNTVWPANSQASGTADNAEATDSLNDLLKSHPYNPLWAQLGDLYGALGSPTKVAKTIITTNGRKAECVGKLLACMTYFIRCGEVTETSGSREEPDEEALAALARGACDKRRPGGAFDGVCGGVRVAGGAPDAPFASLQGGQETVIVRRQDSSRVSTLQGSEDSLMQQNSSGCTLQGGEGSANVRTQDSSGCTLQGGEDSLMRQDSSSCTLQDGENSVNVMRQESSGCTLQGSEESLMRQDSSSCTLQGGEDSLRRQDSSSCTLQGGEDSVNVRRLDSSRVSTLQGGEDSVNVRSQYPSSCTLQGRESLWTVGCPSSKDAGARVRTETLITGSPVDVGPSQCCAEMPTWTHCAPFDSTNKTEGASVEAHYGTPRPDRLSSEFPGSAEESGFEGCSRPEPSNDLCSPNPGTSGFYAEDVRKRLDVKLEMLGRGAERFEGGREFAAHALGGGNFASPAGAEWENENRPTHGGGGRSHDKSYPAGENPGCQGDQTFPGASPERLEGAASHSGCEYPYRLARRLFADEESPSDDRAGTTGGNLPCSTVDDGRGGTVRKAVDGPESRTENGDLYRSGSAYGLRSMRRTSRCVSQMSDLKSAAGCGPSPPSPGLYPSIEELARMENVRLDSEPLYPDRESGGFETSKGSFDEGDLNELITEKVSRLCRVPTVAVMFHLEPEGEESDTGPLEAMPPVEGLEPRRLDAERQTRAPGGSRGREGGWPRDPGVRRASSSEVLFVLGDDEELKGIARQSSRSNSNVDQVPSPRESGGDGSGDLWGQGAGGEGEPRVVTVRSRRVDLEQESGCDARSFSASLPAARHNRRARKSGKVTRRHTEKYCDRCRAALRLECGVGGGCERCRLRASPPADTGPPAPAPCDPPPDSEELESSLEPEVADRPREDNAIFEQYDPSDEEILGPAGAEPRVAAPRDISYDDLHIVDLPLPRCDPRAPPRPVGLAASLLGGVSPRYVPDLVLQGCTAPPLGWEAALRRDLTLAARLPLLGHEVAEAVCIVANTHTWEVQLVSSHAYVVDKPGTLGVCVGMSQLVADMLESLVRLWRLRTPPEHCLLHVEAKLRELYLRSRALAELLLTTEFCSMELLTTSLDLEANDVPLLLAVASTHSPRIAHRYGLSFG